MDQTRLSVEAGASATMDTRDVSVIIATRGDSDLLPTALAHLEVQTYPAARFEILLVNYGAADEASDVLERYAAGAPVRTSCHRLPGGDAARARNLAANNAVGSLLLFLDAELLAGSNLVEAHKRAHEGRREPVAVSGGIRVHPQVESRTFTKVFRMCPYNTGRSEDVSGLVDWGFYNLSLSREAFLSVGGFDESIPYDGLQDLILAVTLERKGIALARSDEAAAYAWRPIRLEEERRRQYLHGYSLPNAVKRTGAEGLLAMFPVTYHPARAWTNRLLTPLYRHMFNPLNDKSGSIDFICDHILADDFYQGYRDAVANRTPLYS